MGSEQEDRSDAVRCLHIHVRKPLHVCCDDHRCAQPGIGGDLPRIGQGLADRSTLDEDCYRGRRPHLNVQMIA